MSVEAAHKSRWETSEVVFGIPFLAAIALQFVVPVSLPRGLFTPVFMLGGAALILLGLSLFTIARRELTRQGQPTGPGLPTSQVVTTGVFSISRNPLYLGVAIFLLGIVLAFNLPWALVSLVLSLFACRYVLIAPEEKYLTARFGEEYRRYAASVRRWIGRARTG